MVGSPVGSRVGSAVGQVLDVLPHLPAVVAARVALDHLIQSAFFKPQDTF